jgi:predicted XRE-type DNA-binding protein
MAKRQDSRVTASSGNVFADMGVPEPEEELAKAQMASLIRRTVGGSRLSQDAAGKVMGIDRKEVSALLNGRLRSFSSERLMRLLTRFGHDVEIVLGPRPRRRERGQIRTVAGT